MSCKEKILAVIPARGGSKRIPKKNIKFFLGKPILVYSIEAAIKCELFEDVMVSTDDKEIAQIAEQSGAIVPFYRSKEASNDFATTAEVLIEVINEYKKTDKNFDWVCCIYPTAPFVTGEKLLDAWNFLIQQNCNALTPVAKFSYPPQRSFLLNNKYLEYNWPENRNKRSQDLQPFYHDVGQFYFLKVDKLLEEKSLLLEKTIPYIIEDMEMQDIDNESDWMLAELKYKAMWLKRKKTMK